MLAKPGRVKFDLHQVSFDLPKFCAADDSMHGVQTVDADQCVGGCRPHVWRTRGSLSEISGGGGGIRTPGKLSLPTVFKTVSIDHSATPPQGKPGHWSRHVAWPAKVSSPIRRSLRLPRPGWISSRRNGRGTVPGLRPTPSPSFQRPRGSSHGAAGRSGRRAQDCGTTARDNR